MQFSTSLAKKGRSENRSLDDGLVDDRFPKGWLSGDEEGDDVVLLYGGGFVDSASLSLSHLGSRLVRGLWFLSMGVRRPSCFLFKG